MRRLLSGAKQATVGSHAKDAWKWNLATTSVKLAVLIALPSCSWYLATPLTSMTSITAIYNVFAFWAYLLAVRMLGEPASRAKLASVLLAILGVMVISLGGVVSGEAGPEPEAGSHPLVGDLLALFGSVSFAYYEIW